MAQRREWAQGQAGIVPRLLLAGRGGLDDKEEYHSWRTNREQQASLQGRVGRNAPPVFGHNKIAPEPLISPERFEDRGWQDEQVR